MTAVITSKPLWEISFKADKLSKYITDPKSVVLRFAAATSRSC
jgi:hypothetical protein